MTSPQAIARMVDRAARKAAVGRARSAQVRFNGVGLPDLITFPDGSTAPPLFATHTSTLMPGGASPARLTLPMLVVPLDGGGWVPVAYMPDQADYLVETTVSVPVQTVWQKATPGTRSTLWDYQVVRTGASAVARQGWQYDPQTFGSMDPDGTFVAVAYFGSLAAAVPSGATVHAVKLALTHRAGEHTGGVAAPIVSGHTYTPATPPTIGTPPAFAAGRRVTGAPMTPGQSQQIDLWATEMLAGTLTGIALGNNPTGGEPVATGADYSGLRVLITYTGGATSA